MALEVGKGELSLSIAWGAILMAIALAINLLTQWIKRKVH
jgi:ABC-type tungstate transport system substrate-binding protein